MNPSQIKNVIKDPKNIFKKDPKSNIVKVTAR